MFGKGTLTGETANVHPSPDNSVASAPIYLNSHSTTEGHTFDLHKGAEFAPSCPILSRRRARSMTNSYSLPREVDLRLGRYETVLYTRPLLIH